jgi:formylglycine-generating enzyme required for sulfatase activity
MADIFISYAREDIATAQALAAALEGLGWSVFWDRRIPAGRRFDEFIAEQLAAARCVLVLWSGVAINSEWVIEEAGEAKERNVLAPALIAPVKPPFGFRTRQCADLIGWQGDAAHPGFTQMLDDIARLAGPPPKRVAEEEAARLRAEEERQRAEAEARRKAEEERQRADVEAKRNAEQEQRERHWREQRSAEIKRQLAEQEAQQARQETAGKPPEAEAAVKAGQPSRRSWLMGAGTAVLVIMALVAIWQSGQEEPKPVPGERLQATEPAPTPQPAAKPTGATGVAGKLFQDCDVCPSMVPLPGGTFLMGSPPEEAGRSDDEGPQHTVTVKPFAIGQYEVTFDEWDACVAAGGCNGYRPDDRGVGGGGRHPVIWVKWQHAKDYVTWLAKHTGKPYRLPSEAEWEYAARAGTTTAFALPAPDGSDDIAGRGLANCNGCGGRSRFGTMPVGSFAPNAWDLYDMHGNVWEWVEDVWHLNYKGAPTDGSAWIDGKQKKSSKITRGGSWGAIPDVVRSATRFGIADYHDGHIGFRVARSLD